MEEMLGVGSSSVLPDSHCPLLSKESLKMTGVDSMMLLFSRMMDKPMRRQMDEWSILCLNACRG